MKIKALLLAVALAGSVVSAAAATPPPGKDKGARGDQAAKRSEQAQNRPCRPQVSLVLKGLFVSAAEDGKSFTMNVKRANRHARALAGEQVLLVSEYTRFRRDGHATLADLRPGDRVLAQVRACKATSAAKRDRLQQRLERLNAKAERLRAHAARLVQRAAADEQHAERLERKAERLRARADRLTAQAGRLTAQLEAARLVPADAQRALLAKAVRAHAAKPDQLEAEQPKADSGDSAREKDGSP